MYILRMDDLLYDGKEIVISVHAIKRARERNIAFPYQVYSALQTGRVEKFGKNGIKFISKSKSQGSIICIGEDKGHIIIIKTIERGN